MATKKEKTNKQKRNSSKIEKGNILPDHPIEEKRLELPVLFDHIQRGGLIYSDHLLTRFVLSLLTKSFVILTGLSGSGKTQLALTFARWISEKSEQVRLVSVGADWTNREHLLGYPNALDPLSYICPENNAIDILLEAQAHPYKPYFLILDEMNLSYVERYFADFLSAMESNLPIRLHAGKNKRNEYGIAVPDRISLPKNLFIIGTVNVDETTYMFSPKVLDRANVIEFRVSRAEMAGYLKKKPAGNKESIETMGSSMASHFVQLAKQPAYTESTGKEFQDILLDFFTGLEKAGAEFGFRTVSEILRFHDLSGKLYAGKDQWNENHIMDYAIIQKLLPKLYGSRKKIVPVLEEVWQLSLLDKHKKVLLDVHPPADSFENLCRYPVSAEKIWRMYRNACENGFTSFAEA